MPLLTDILGLKIAVPSDKRHEVLELINRALGQVEALSASKENILPGLGMTIALSGAFQSANALLGVAAAKCSLAAPPEDIEATQDDRGALILRCFHNPAHKWDWNGQPIR